MRWMGFSDGMIFNTKGCALIRECSSARVPKSDSCLSATQVRAIERALCRAEDSVRAAQGLPRFCLRHGHRRQGSGHSRTAQRRLDPRKAACSTGIRHDVIQEAAVAHDAREMRGTRMPGPTSLHSRPTAAS